MDARLIPRRAGSGLEHAGLTMERFRQSLNGEAFLRGEDGYDRARQVWNGAIAKRPAMIIYCADAADVSRAVTFARSGGYLVAVRSGGHNVAGLSVCDDGIAIDLTRLKRIEIDPLRRIARADAGLSLGEFDRATQSHGLATTMGVSTAIQASPG
ncbi:FAD-binding oxidoreductase [Cupriavidus alkaliphilus]|uniref:FAD-binding oxidoreductase n=1 Tax=Cupriavidus alkaliphilus TaxID=942866 RepID=UPI00339D8438